MRDIKFRAWDKEKKVMRSDYSSVGFTVEIMDGDFIVRDGEIATEMGGKERFELMQFTGLKDKNGVEIYEGDILIWEEALKGKKDRKHLVKWNFADLQALEIGEKYELLEVIGNIYENPELLK